MLLGQGYYEAAAPNYLDSGDKKPASHLEHSRWICSNDLLEFEQESVVNAPMVLLKDEYLPFIHVWTLWRAMA